MKAQIISINISPPIPDRRFDWQSYREGNEEIGPYGYGSTKEEAEADLITLEELNKKLKKKNNLSKGGNLLSPRKLLPELLRMNLYQTSRGEHFYAWSHKHAIKKRPKELIYFINSLDRRILIMHKTN